MIFRTFLIVTSVGLLGCSALRAPGEAVTQGTQDAILRAVAEYMLANVASKTAHVDREVDIVLDRAILPRGGVDRGPSWPASLLEDIAAHAGVRVGTLKDHHTCPKDGPPGHCYLEGADIVVTIGRPDLDGDSGTIWVKEVGRATVDIDSPRAYGMSANLKIERVDGAWHVVGADFISVSN